MHSPVVALGLDQTFDTDKFTDGALYNKSLCPQFRQIEGQ
jgi:hypothetical protein